MWTAADCNNAGCNATQSTPVTVTINNAAPAVTAPVESATTGPNPQLDADSADGGGVEFFVDGDLVGFDSTAPYSVVVSTALIDGVHSAVATGCDTTGTVCDGPSSAAVDFTVASLHPQITLVSPNPFSPNRDGRDDITSFRISIPDPENVSYVIRDHNGALVKSPHPPGDLGAGNHTFAWGGTSNAGTVAPSGIYTIVVSTSAVQNAFTVHGTATAPVTLDNFPPTLSHITGNGFTFYPIVDHYLDDFSPKVTVSEPGTLQLFVFTSTGRIIRVISGPHAAAGTFLLTWNGRNRGGAMMPAGTYGYEFVGLDKAGNRRVSARDFVHVSRRHLVNRTTTFTVNGDARDHVYETALGCGLYSTFSSFSHGLRMRNPCFSNPNIIFVFATYHHTVPAAHAYTSVHVKSYGDTDVAPSHTVAGVLNVNTAKYVSLPRLVALGNTKPQWSDYGQINGAGLVRSRQLQFAIFVPNTDNPNTDYDVGLVRVIVGYDVLI